MNNDNSISDVIVLYSVGIYNIHYIEKIINTEILAKYLC